MAMVSGNPPRAAPRGTLLWVGGGAGGPGMDVGQDVAAYGATKFEPPVAPWLAIRWRTIRAFPPTPRNRKHAQLPTIITEGEEVIVTEKLHGTNCRVGFVAKPLEHEALPAYSGIPAEDDTKEEMEMVRMAAHGLRRKEPEDAAAMRNNTYWFPWRVEGVEALLKELFLQGRDQAILYGEIFWSTSESFNYGRPAIAFRAFHLMIDGNFVRMPISL